MLTQQTFPTSSNAADAASNPTGPSQGTTTLFNHGGTTTTTSGNAATRGGPPAASQKAPSTSQANSEETSTQSLGSRSSQQHSPRTTPTSYARAAAGAKDAPTQPTHQSAPSKESTEALDDGTGRATQQEKVNSAIPSRVPSKPRQPRSTSVENSFAVLADLQEEEVIPISSPTEDTRNTGLDLNLISKEQGASNTTSTSPKGSSSEKSKKPRTSTPGNDPVSIGPHSSSPHRHPLKLNEADTKMGEEEEQYQGSDEEMEGTATEELAGVDSPLQGKLWNLAGGNEEAPDLSTGVTINVTNTCTAAWEFRSPSVRSPTGH
ncbi:hypothetical protein R1sor_006651 [Riccia sorocarpa]|uniref:Uncharacterized protein n=1 Tax=Riccia sorocarpa TaxID=122646 RepID=A0ABD3HN18_9MARC